MAEPKMLIPLPDDMDRLMKPTQWQAGQIERLRERVFELEADPNSGDVISLAAERERCAKKPLTRQQIDDVMTQHYPLSSLLREEVDAFEACVRDLERLHGIGA